MIPIGDDNVRGRYKSWITWLLIVINVVVFLYENSLSQAGLEEFVLRYGVVPAVILQGENLGSLITSMFLHGGWLHLIGNMLFLWVFGDNIEVVMGHWLYLLFYLLGGLVGSAAHILSNPGSEIPSIGASGAIAAVLGSYVVMFPHSRVRVLLFILFFVTVTRVRALLFLGIWAVMQFFNGIASLGVRTVETAGVAYWAHIGGFIFGLLIGFMFKGRASRFALVVDYVPSRY